MPFFPSINSTNHSSPEVFLFFICFIFSSSTIHLTHFLTKTVFSALCRLQLFLNFIHDNIVSDVNYILQTAYDSLQSCKTHLRLFFVMQRKYCHYLLALFIHHKLLNFLLIFNASSVYVIIYAYLLLLYIESCLECFLENKNV